jgi:hypothetical protein
MRDSEPCNLTLPSIRKLVMNACAVTFKVRTLASAVALKSASVKNAILHSSTMLSSLEGWLYTRMLDKVGGVLPRRIFFKESFSCTLKEHKVSLCPSYLCLDYQHVGISSAPSH